MMVKLHVRTCFSLIVFSLFLVRCDDIYDPVEQAKIKEKKILKYIEENELDAEKHSSGLYYVIENEGSGNSPTLESYVKLNYEATFIDGEVISQGYGSNFYLPNEIEGLQIGIPLFKRGGKGILLIPSALAYGGYYHPVYDINRVLVYHIELIDF